MDPYWAKVLQYCKDVDPTITYTDIRGNLTLVHKDGCVCIDSWKIAGVENPMVTVDSMTAPTKDEQAVLDDEFMRYNMPPLGKHLMNDHSYTVSDAWDASNY